MLTASLFHLLPGFVDGSFLLQLLLKHYAYYSLEKGNNCC